jgi:uncharacterized membrane protein YczE
MTNKVPIIKRMSMYILGCILFSIGAKLFIDSNLGTDPLDVLQLGIVKHTGLLIGTVAAILSVVFLFLWVVWNKKFPPLTPFLTMFGVGYLIDLWNYLQINHWTQLLNNYFLLFLGLLAVIVSSSLIIMSNIGIRIMDLVALTIVEKWEWSFTKAKMLFEIGFVVFGYLLGGPLGIGTLAFTLLVGTGIEPIAKLLKKLGIPNYGLKTN